MFGPRTKIEKVDIKWLTRAMELLPQTPISKSGPVEIEHRHIEAGKCLDVVSARNAVFQQQQMTSVRFTHDQIIRVLKEKKIGVWMTDYPIEVYQAHEAIEAIRDLDAARVLVGGLGLGVYSRLLLAMGACDYVTTVELNPHVVKLVRTHCWHGGNHRVEVMDLTAYLARIRRGKFDAAILDIWQPTGEQCFVEQVVPLRRLARSKIDHVWCWNEREMHGQFWSAAHRKLLFAGKDTTPMDVHYRALRYAAEDEGLVGEGIETAGLTFEVLLQAEAELLKDKRIEALMRDFLDDIGSPEWEQRFGRWWDTAAAERPAMERARRRRHARNRAKQRAKQEAT